MTLTANFLYYGPDMPDSTVCPSNLNEFHKVRRINATADVADLLCAGVFCYLTAGTNTTDMTPATADFGDDAREGIICIVEIKKSDPRIVTTVDRIQYPNKVPNTTCTITDYTPAENTSIIVIPLEVNMWVWCLGSVNGSWDTTFGYGYTITTNGLLGAVEDPDGIAIDISSWYFTSMATTVNQNWCLVRVDGKVAYDKTA